MVMLAKKLHRKELEFFVKVHGRSKCAEIKEDGDRIRMKIKNKKATLFNRRGDDVTFRYPEFHYEIDLPDMFLDGEMCVKDEMTGKSIFSDGIAHRTHLKHEQDIKAAMVKYPVTYVVFDLMELDIGPAIEVYKYENMRNQGYETRRGILEMMSINDIPHFELVTQSMDIIALWEHAIENEFEGIIIKDMHGLYHEGKRRDVWLKVKDVNDVDLWFTKYEHHPKGITIETDDGIRCTVNGEQSQEVVELFEANGKVLITIEYLGKQSKTGKYRQPAFKKVVVNQE